MAPAVPDAAGVVQSCVSERSCLRGEILWRGTGATQGDVVSQVIEGPMRCWGFLTVWKKSGMPCSRCCCRHLRSSTGKAALTYRFGEDHQPVTESQILSRAAGRMRAMTCGPRTSVCRENLIKGGLSGRNAKVDGHIPVPCAVLTGT